MVGTEPFPEHFRAKKYKINKKFLSRQEFRFIMKSLPEHVSDEDIDLMFSTADTDHDDNINYQEFSKMIIPAKPQIVTKPSRTEFVQFYKNSSE